MNLNPLRGVLTTRFVLENLHLMTSYDLTSLQLNHWGRQLCEDDSSK